MKKFEVNQKYVMHSPCHYDCTWIYKVIKRTEKTVTLEDEEGRIKNCRIRTDLKEEVCNPLGRYSMCPTLCADLGRF